MTFFVAVCGILSGCEPVGFVVAEKGRKPDCRVVVERTDETAAYAAEELTNYVWKSTGVLLPVGAGESARRIVLAPGPAELGEDGFHLSVCGNELRIEGGRRGVLYGVHAFLRRFAGVEWYSSWCEEVPARDRLVVPPDFSCREKPAFEIREVFWKDPREHPPFAARIGMNNRSLRQADPKTGCDAWRFGGGLANCHTFEKLVPSKRYFATHPEYFSEVGGHRLRERTQLCLTNPEVRDLVISNVLEAIRRDPTAPCYGVSQNDCHNECRCANCRAVDEREGSPSGTVVSFVNDVADAVRAKHPDKTVETLAYLYSRKPPKTVRPRDNVMICLCSIECDASQPLATSRYAENVRFVSDLRGWASMTKNLYVWDYVTNFRHFLLPYPNVNVLQENLRLFRDSGVRYMFEQGVHNGYHGEFAELKAWLLGRWMWNPDLPREELLDRFFRGYYGQAAPFVRKYFDELESFSRDEATNPLLNMEEPGRGRETTDDAFLARADGLWREAEKAVADDPARLYNVKMSALSVDYALFLRYFRHVNLSTNAQGRAWAAPAKRLAEGLKAAEAAGHPVLFCESVENSGRLRKRVVAAARGGDAVVGDGSSACLQECEFRRYGDGAAKLVDDPQAEDGKALRLPNDVYMWLAQFSLDDVAFDADAEYELSVRLRAELTGKPGAVAEVGVYDPSQKKTVGLLNLDARFASGSYATYSVCTWKPRAGQVLYVAPGRFDQKKDGISPAHNGVWVDSVTIRRKRPTVAKPWTVGEPITTYWAGPGWGRTSGRPLTEADAIQLKEGGFNTVWATTLVELDVAARHGLRAIYDPGLDRCDFSNAVAVAKVEAEIARVKDHPALYFYHLADEPPAGKFAALREVKDWVAARDPNHPVWINLLPTYANNRQLGVEGEILAAYREHVQRFCDVFRPAFLSYDHYQFNVGGDTPNYFLNLDIVRGDAAARGLPFMNGVQACTWRPNGLASPGSPRIPGADELRYLVYTTLAYGAQGIYYYVYYHPTHAGAIVEKGGVTGEKYEAVKVLNRAFVAIARELRDCTFAGAYCLGRQARGMSPYGPEAVLGVGPKVPNAELEKNAHHADTTLVTRFTSPDGRDRFMVVNLDYRKDRRVTLSAPSALERFDVASGTWKGVGMASGGLALGKGEGVLLRLAK